MQTSALGSYPRIGDGPERQKLRRAIQGFQAGRIDADALRRTEDEVTREVLDEQQAAGLDWLTDGHVRWEDGQTYFTDRLEGFQRGGLLRYFDTNTYYRQPVVVGDVRWKAPITVENYRFASAHAKKPVRPVITGPLTLAALSLDEHYKNAKRLVADLTAALRQEIDALAAAGAQSVQVDEPVLTRRPTDAPWVRETMQALFGDAKVPVWVALYMGSTAALLDQVGSWPAAGVWLDCVSDPSVLDRLGAHPGANGQQVGIGIVDARNTKLESVDDLVAQLRRATRSVPAERAVATTSAGLEFLPRDRAQQKLERLVESVRSFAKTG